MKIIKKALVIICVVTHPLIANDSFNKTFLSVRPQFQVGTPERETMLRDPFITTFDRGCLELVPFVGRSANSHKLSRYFFPFGRTELLVAEDGSPFASVRDVNAIHLNINHVQNTFASQVKFHYSQVVAGLGFAYRFKFFDESENGWWAALSAPVEMVQNKVCIQETILNAGGALEATRVANVTQAFKQPSWNFGRVDGKKHTKVGLADIEGQFGYAWQPVGYYADLYLGFVIPTGNAPRARNVFEPIVGNNKHGGILAGGTVAHEILHHKDRSIHLILSTNSRYLFSNIQQRSFDLTDKQWGRYMEVYDSIEDAQAADDAITVANGNHGSPGINVFTKCVKVRPGFSNLTNLAFLYKHSNFNAEIGYELACAQDEKVQLAAPWQEGPALVSGVGAGSTSKSRTINHNADGSDDVFLPNYAVLTCSDLDISTASNPAYVDHIVYASVGYFVDDHRIQPLVSSGVSYEFSADNTSLDRWLVWAKIGLTH